MWVLRFFSIKSSWQKLDCKNVKYSTESADRPINFTLSSNSLFWPPSTNSSCFGTSPLSILEKIFVSSGIGYSFIFWSSSWPRYPQQLPSSASGKSSESCYDKWISYLSRSCFSFFGTISIILVGLSIRFVIGRSKSVFRTLTIGLCEVCWIWWVLWRLLYLSAV